MRLAKLLVCAVAVGVCFAGNTEPKLEVYKVLAPITQENLTLFPVVSVRSFSTAQFLTLDEGIRSGEVVVSELGFARGLVRPRSVDPAMAHVFVARPSASVNTLALTNNSSRPLILLAGEIVTGGKQDRVVGKDRIVPPHSEPVSLDVFCVEPHRWVGASLQFGGTAFSMTQPSIRMKAMAEQNQEEVWSEVARSRAAFASALPAAQAPMLQSSSSYAAAVGNDAVRQRLESITRPFERSYSNLREQLRSQKAVGAIVAINGELIWADVFASEELFDRYWPKLIRSYAAESLSPRVLPTSIATATQVNAQRFLDSMYGNHESIETDPGVYRFSEVQGDSYKVFVLDSLLPDAGFVVHLAKMEQVRGAVY